MRRNPRILVFSAGVRDVATVEAATRAGALGVLDLCWLDEPGLLAASPRLRRLADQSSRPFGVRVDVCNVTPAWLASLPEIVTTIIASASTHAGHEVQRAVSLIQQEGRTAWAEVVTRESALVAVTSGATGLIVVGHEAGGFVGDDSSFILAQAVVAQVPVPVWVRGGIGPRVAAGCVALGAAGVVLDGAALLTRESSLTPADRSRIARWDGGETRVFGPRGGGKVRAFVPPGSPLLDQPTQASDADDATWEGLLRSQVGWNPGQAWPIGQDAALAGALTGCHPTVGDLVRVVEEAIGAWEQVVSRARPLAAEAPLAKAHGTRYPILQGPMTRVSDVAEFANAVAGGGALPFLALALLRGEAIAPLLQRAQILLAEKPWGVGLLGFVSPELRREQVAAVLAARPPFALIAGGRPDQARELEDGGITTYLHVPSPGLLSQFIREGGRRFVLEGRECGGHVGPRSSFVLWEQALDVVNRAVGEGANASDFHLVFAGGIHDAPSARFVAALAGPAAQSGVKVGVLVGTAYLFTVEAVATGAIVERYQAEAVRCNRTTLLETGPGHQVRVGPSPFVATFAEERQRLQTAGISPGDARETLERLNAGRLRVATKGVDRSGGADSPLVAVAHADQFDRGIYMLGQVATLRDQITTIADLHRSIAESQPASKPVPPPLPAEPSDIAIVGMAAILPGAGDVQTFWENTLRKHNAVTEVPADRWDWRLYYDADPKAPDKVVSKWGGFVPDIPFDPIQYGMPPSSLPSIEPVQLLLLEATRAAIADAGYADRPFERERTAVVLGMGGGAAQLAMGYAFRSYLPMLDAVTPGSGKAALEACQGLLPEWTEDSFPGFLLNVAAGRVANRFDLGGANYTVDAACGSSLAAAALAVRELETGSADVVLLGGADTVQNPFTYLAFSKTHAFSPRGRCRPFDASADGIVISEGVAMVVLKRLKDAERDGDRIYSVIKGLGASSDGRARGLTAPSPAGQVRAVERAYAKAGVEPRTIGYVEAHGTGTAVGDVVEVNAIAGVFRDHGVPAGAVALGSVKSMIGHTKCAAGLAGLINASLALHHRVLPPTIGVETVNPKADLKDGPFRVSTAALPWIQADPACPRRAGVSAFGFGGTNFHAVLEAYEANSVLPVAPGRIWPAELLVWRPADRTQLGRDLTSLVEAFDRGASPHLRDLARAVNDANPPSTGTGSRPTLALVADSLTDLTHKLRQVVSTLAGGHSPIDDPRGVFYREVPEFAGAPVAFLFPGQGSQTPGMLTDLAIAFPEVLDTFATFDQVLTSAGHPAVGPVVFPLPDPVPSAQTRATQRLAATELAQPALGAASVALLRLLGSFGIDANMVAGHSFGELVALHAAGSMNLAGLARLAAERGRLMQGVQAVNPGSMVAVAAGIEQIAPLLGSFRSVAAVNENGPNQTVLAGSEPDLSRAVQALQGAGCRVKELPVAGAFHSELMSAVREPLAQAARPVLTSSPECPVYSNLDARPHPSDPAAIAYRIGEHAVRPVRFAPMIEAMHAAGARVFVEVGPGSVLTALVGSILAGRPHLALACDSATKPGIPTLLTTLARLAVAGVPVRLDRLTAGRSSRRLDLSNLPVGDGSPAPSPTTWMVNGSRSRPIAQPEPKRLGQSADLLGRPTRTEAQARPSVLPPAVPSSPAQARNGHQPRPVASPSRPENALANGHLISNGNGHPHSSGGSSNGKAMNPSNHPSPRSLVPHADSPPAGSASSAEERVLASFQETMRTFLDVQRSTMLAYLSGRAEPAAPVMPDPTGSVTPPVKPVILPAPISDRLTGGLTPSASALAPNQPVIPLNPTPVLIPSVPVVLQPTTVALPIGREVVTNRLVEIVSDRTGYPAEMLGLDLDLEADLGIDSIKRVEILGSLRESVAALGAITDPSAMDSLSRARTLGAIVDRVDEIVQRQAQPPITLNPQASGNEAQRESHPAAATATAPPDPADAEPEPAGSAVRRLVIEAVPAPLASFRATGGILPGGVVVITDDGRGVGRALATRFEAQGHPVVLVGSGKFDLGSPASVDLLLAKARARGPIAALVHASPLRHVEVAADLDPDRWAARLTPEVKGLFLLAKGVAPDLERAARRGGSALVAATAMGGSFAAVPGGPTDFFPGHGGVAGLVKTLAREWTGVRTRVVDFDLRDEVEGLADRLADETLLDDDWSEVGYAGGHRIRLQATPARLDRHNSVRLDLRSGDPVVITGGARGITAAVAIELAQRWQPTLLLIGRSALPPDHEDASTAQLEATSDLKAELLNQLRSNGKAVTPADLDRAYQTIRQAREIRTNLAAIRATGTVVTYAPVDVRDATSLGQVLSNWRQVHGNPVGLIHGAGVIQDKLIRDKTLASFDAVLGTKLDGALNLARLLDPTTLRFTALFSSIAGRFGNSGQSDYAAANEVLNKLAQWLDARWPGRVVALNWGPWSGVGMVSDLEGHLGGRGLGMIPPDVGRTMLLDELRFGAKGQVEVVLAGNLGNLDAPVEQSRPTPDRVGARSGGTAAGATR